VAQISGPRPRPMYGQLECGQQSLTSSDPLLALPRAPHGTKKRTRKREMWSMDGAQNEARTSISAIKIVLPSATNLVSSYLALNLALN
jgi:hypothetical protein